MTKNIVKFFDKLEDKTRAMLSRMPILYAFVGGIGVVLFWRGVWHTTDFLTAYFLGEEELSFANLMDGPLSFILGTVILLITGVYVSAFIGNRLIISGLSGEKKLAEKTEDEIKAEEDEIKKLQRTISKVESHIENIEKEIEHHHPKN
ncbi:MAG TPA: hypothetical protein PLZ99_00680 [Parcubacteria group bacterium]|jgi:hypothetical protein|nr:hypothetical protein [Parcubacteria group bacterium]